MPRTILFIGLTRPVTFAGLPILYLMLLLVGTMLGFILTKSFLYLILTPGIGYPVLRALSAFDPKVMDVFFVVMRSTRMAPGLFSKSGVNYRA
jgi:type IV secretory pathway VirB3-like protein